MLKRDPSPTATVRMHESLTTVREVMASPVSVAASETVAVAADLIRRHKIPGLAVVDGGRVVGVVTAVDLLRQPLYRPVSEAMTPDVTPAEPELSLLQARVLFTRQGLDVLPVVEDGRLTGLLSLNAVLEATRQESDPLTGLPWSPALRAWAGARLAAGHEVAILFVDLDNFHLVNRALGHVTGDHILRSVAVLLSDLIEPATDVLCRYGGDEFAIATTRAPAEVAALARRIREHVTVRRADMGEARPVSASVGVAGGQRVELRAASHIAATVEDLLTLASRGSTLAKESPRGVVHHSRVAEETARRDSGPTGPAEVRVRLKGVAVHTESGRSSASVELLLGKRTGTGTAAGRAQGRGVSFLVAEATLQALTQTMGDEYTFTVDDLVELPSGDAQVVVVILSTGAGKPDRFVGAARDQDAAQAVPKAILDALNRRLAGPAAEILRRNGSNGRFPPAHPPADGPGG